MAGQFYVQPGKLRGCSEQVRRAANDLTNIGFYVQHTATNTDGFDGLLSGLRGSVESFGDRHGQELGDWSDRLRRSGAGLMSAATQYEDADARGAKNIDAAGAQMGGRDGSSPSSKGGEGDGPFEDPVEPQASLKEPTPEQDDPSLAVQDIGSVLPSIDWVIQKLTGWSLLETILKPISGDWIKIRLNADAWRNVGVAADGVSDNLQHAVTSLKSSWTGEAADAFNRHIKLWRQGLRDEKDLATAVQHKMEAMAQTSQQIFRELSDILGQIVDKAVATAATSWIPGAGWGKAAKALVDLVTTAFALVDRLKNLVELASDVFDAADAKLNSDPPEAKIPDKGYSGELPALG